MNGLWGFSEMVWLSQCPGHREGSQRLASRWSWLLPLHPQHLYYLLHMRLLKRFHIFMFFTITKPAAFMVQIRKRKPRLVEARDCTFLVLEVPPIPYLPVANTTTGVCPDHVEKAGTRAHGAIFEVDLCYLSSIFYFVCSGSSPM